jgi:hypothetical protein
MAKAAMRSLNGAKADTIADIEIQTAMMTTNQMNAATIFGAECQFRAPKPAQPGHCEQKAAEFRAAGRNRKTGKRRPLGQYLAEWPL